MARKFTLRDTFGVIFYTFGVIFEVIFGPWDQFGDAVGSFSVS